MKHAIRGAAALLLLAGCRGGNGLPEVESVQKAIVVKSFDDCTGLEQYIEDRVALSMRAQLTAQFEDERGGVTLPSPGLGMASAAPSENKSTTPEQTGNGPAAYTKTNTQVGGVDEADIVKTDGTHVLALSRGKLHVVQSWPADRMEKLSEVALEFTPLELFLDEAGRVVVFSNKLGQEALNEQPQECYPEKPETCVEPEVNVLKITVVDLTDVRSPRVVREEYLPGTYVSSRRVGETVRVVMSGPFRWPLGVKMALDWSDGRGDLALREAAYQQLMDANEKLIRARTLEQWLPPGHRRLGDGAEVPVPYACTDFAYPSGPTQAGLVTVATLELGATAPVALTSLVARANEIYSTEGSLYVANAHWWWWPRPGQSEWTYVHKFDVSQPGRATWVASGAVEGVILDQFSMDEHEGFLRLATNLLDRDPGSTWRGTLAYRSRVQVMAQMGGELTMVGSTGDLALNERLYSSRFIGDKGYLVTYHEVIRMDPLFTLDLRDPAAPRMVGQLEIPGYSTYLHPIDAGHLLAVGVTEASGVKVSLYDVTDFAHPKKQSEVEVGAFSSGASGTSEAQREHKAFNYFPAKRLLAIPFFSERYPPVSDLHVYRIDVTAGQYGIALVGALGMSDLWGVYDSSLPGWTPGVRRSVMADDFVYAISEAGIRSANVADLATPLSTVEFAPTP